MFCLLQNILEFATALNKLFVFSYSIMYSIYSADSEFVLHVEKKMYVCITFYFSGKFSEIPAMGAIRARVQVRYYCILCVKYNQSLFTQRNIYTNEGHEAQALGLQSLTLITMKIKKMLLRTSDRNAIVFSILMTEIDSFQSNGKKYLMVI